MLVAAWVLITVGIGVWASRWGRNGFGWAVASLIFSPLIAAIALLIAGNNMKKEFHIVTNEDGSQTIIEHNAVKKEEPSALDRENRANALKFMVLVAAVLVFIHYIRSGITF